MTYKTDGLQSLLSGLGDPLRDKNAGSTYNFPFVPDTELLNAYRGSWAARKLVNIPAVDAVRKWRDWQAEASDITKIEAEENRLNLRGKMLEVLTRARLFGGAAILIGTGDADLMRPIELEKIGKGGIKYLTVLSRLDLVPGEIGRDPTSETFNKPVKYTIQGPVATTDIHPSRLAIFHGNPHPEPRWAFGSYAGWGDSILVSAWDAVRNADGVQGNISSLVYEANVDVFGVKDLFSLLDDPEFERRLLSRFTLANMNKAVNRSLIMDFDEKFERKQVSFAGLTDVLFAFMQIVSGAADIPVTRFLGQSPGGLNSTGEADIRNYYDRIAGDQAVTFTPALYTLDEALQRSALGSRDPATFYKWASLWQITDAERATIGKTMADTAQILNNTGLISPEALSSSVVNQLTEMSVYPGLETAVKDSPTDFEALLNQAETKQPPAPGDITIDMEPRPLYVRRDVKNTADIVAWAKEQGLGTPMPDMHVTIVYSTAPLDWMQVGEAWQAELKIAAGGPRSVELFGGDSIVLEFASSELKWRHDAAKNAGASSNFDPYRPHITITKVLPGLAPDLRSIDPYKGEIVLGPEIFEDLKK